MTQPYALKAGEGWTYNMGIDFTVKVSETRAGSGAAVHEYTTRKGEEPDPHVHPTEDEIFYVLDGKISFHCAAQTFDLAPGGMVFLPCGMEHGYSIHGDEPVRLLVITAPVRDGAGGWGGFVAEHFETRASDQEKLFLPPVNGHILGGILSPSNKQGLFPIGQVRIPGRESHQNRHAFLIKKIG